MDGVGLSLDIANLLAAEMHISRLALQDGDAQQLMDEIAKLGETQTRRRIESEKTAPDGAPWRPNIEGHSILLESGMHLRDSVASNSSASEAEWGAAWEFAHVHQYGAVILPKNKPKLAFKLKGEEVFAGKSVIPARPFVGISAANAEEISNHVSDFLGRLT